MDGIEQKAEGIDRALHSPTSAPWRVVARAGLLELIRRGGEFTSEALTELVGQPPHPNQVGAVFNAAARGGLIRRTGFVKAERPNQHAAMISSWEPTGAGVELAAGAPPYRPMGTADPLVAAGQVELPW